MAIDFLAIDVPVTECPVTEFPASVLRMIVSLPGVRREKGVPPANGDHFHRAGRARMILAFHNLNPVVTPTSVAGSRR